MTAKTHENELERLRNLQQKALMGVVKNPWSATMLPEN
jgi:hypothetical protein